MPDTDIIFLRNLRTSAVVGPDVWQRPGKPQPLIVNAELHCDTSIAGSSDEVSETVSYGDMCKEFTQAIALMTEGFKDPEQLATHLVKVANVHEWPGSHLNIEVELPKAVLRAKGGLSARCCAERNVTLPKAIQGREWYLPKYIDWHIKGLQPAIIIGVNAPERIAKQTVEIDLTMTVHRRGADRPSLKYEEMVGKHWQPFVQHLFEALERTSFKTLEALAETLAEKALNQYPIEKIAVSLEKPSALHFVDGAGVQVVRKSKTFASLEKASGEMRMKAGIIT